MLCTKLLTLAALLWIPAFARIFPFRIKVFEWDDDSHCDPNTSMTDILGLPYKVRDGDCHTAKRQFTEFSFSKNRSPFSKNMDVFGVCDIELWSEPDCQGDLVDEAEHVNDRQLEEWGCWGMKKEGAEHGTFGGQAWSMRLKCSKD